MNRTCIALLLLASLLVVSGCQNRKQSEGFSNSGFNELLLPVPLHSVLEQEDYWIWGASMVRAGDGTCHLFYSRWPREYEFKDWIYRSEIAYATAESPGGPYTFQKVVLRGQGGESWVQQMAHNPHIKKFGKRYYLYFISYTLKDQGLGERMNHIFSQRIGLATASEPGGPWEVSREPLVDIQEGKAAHGYVTNPSVCQRPDGSYLMMMKSRPGNWQESKKFRSIQCLATSPAPDGPWIIDEQPVMTEFTTEDPFIWFGDDRYYAIVDDQYGDYLGVRGLALFESPDGFTWEPSENPLVSELEISWEGDTSTHVNHLERPQLWFNENGEPAVLFLATQQHGTDGKGNPFMKSFNVHIPLKANL